MLSDVEMMRAFKAIEFLYYGVDISSLNKEDYKKIVKDSKLITDTSKTSFIIQVDDKLKIFLNLFNNYIYRRDSSYSQINDEYLNEQNLKVDTTIVFDTFISVIRTLKELGIDTYSDLDEDILDLSIQEKMDKIDKEFDYSKSLECPLKNELTIEKTDSEIKTLLALADYKDGLGQKIYDYYKEEHNFILNNFKDFEIFNNRIIIPFSVADIYKLKKFYKSKHLDIPEKILKAKAIVISKNPLDYFYASYGNDFQSCFSLNSDYNAFYGFVPYSTTEESFIVYATTGDVMKTSIINGNKFHNPQMIWRAWGWADEDCSLLIDKKYRGNSTDTFIEFCCEFLRDKFNVICDSRTDRTERNLYNKGKALYNIWSKYKFKFYADSLLKKSRMVSFYYSAGNGGVEEGYVPDWRKSFYKFSDYAKTVCEVKNIDLSKKSIVVDGILFTEKTCPITSLPIPCEEEKHTYSKYFSEPIKKIACITYINGSVFCDYCSEMCSTDRLCISDSKNMDRRFVENTLFVAPYISRALQYFISLKTLKEIIKSVIKDTPYGAILLRVIENDKVTIQVFKNKG